MLLLFFALACRDKDDPIAPESEVVESQIESGDSGDGERFSGLDTDEGFGASLAAGALGAIWVGAPFGSVSRIYQIDGSTVSLALEQAGFDAAGTGLAYGDSGLMVGAPLAANGAGRLLNEGGALVEGAAGALLGARVRVQGAQWAATTAQGILTSGGSVELGETPGDLAYGSSGVLWVGLPRGVGEITDINVRYPLGSAGEELGAALCVGELRGDGQELLAVGAPGVGRVYLVPLGEGVARVDEAQVIDLGSGRFGAALACGDGALAVGAPTYGRDASGAVWTLDAEDLRDAALGALRLEGSPGSDLGAAVLWQDGALWVGAPGASEVRVLR